MNGKVLSGPAAVLIIVLFFLPWVTVSCDNIPVGEFSGYNLATGTAPQGSEDVFTGGQIDGDPILFAIPLIGLVTLVLLGITIWKSSFETNAGWGQIIAAFLGLLILGLEWMQLRSQGNGTFDIVIQPALWGTVATLVAIGSGAVFDLVRAGRRPRPSLYMQPPVQGQRPSPPIATPSPYQPATPPAADSNYTIMDEGAFQGSSYANETILDDDLLKPRDMGMGMGSETIIDDEYMGKGGSDYTMRGDERTDYDAVPLPTATSKEQPPAQKPPATPQKEIVWAADDKPTPTKPTPPPEKPIIQKTEVLHFSPESAAWLVIGSGERRGEQFRLLADTLIGRDTSNDIVIDDTAMSTVHLRIRSENGRFFAYDQNSTNGIFIFDSTANRWEKRDDYELKHGDQIKIGRTVLHFMTA
ncbi:MAG: FHA domain-containing protein [Ardenticatenaceae bacterium]|nr:FHA domain-containing protein [Ardenticatenaceae bacterium]